MTSRKLCKANGERCRVDSACNDACAGYQRPSKSEWGTNDEGLIKCVSAREGLQQWQMRPIFLAQKEATALVALARRENADGQWSISR